MHFIWLLMLLLLLGPFHLFHCVLSLPAFGGSLSPSFHYVRHIYAHNYYRHYINARPPALGDVLPQIRLFAVLCVCAKTI